MPVLYKNMVHNITLTVQNGIWKPFCTQLKFYRSVRKIWRGMNEPFPSNLKLVLWSSRKVFFWGEGVTWYLTCKKNIQLAITAWVIEDSLSPVSEHRPVGGTVQLCCPKRRDAFPPHRPQHVMAVTRIATGWMLLPYNLWGFHLQDISKIIKRWMHYRFSIIMFFGDVRTLQTSSCEHDLVPTSMLCGKQHSFSWFIVAKFWNETSLKSHHSGN